MVRPCRLLAAAPALLETPAPPEDCPECRRAASLTLNSTRARGQRELVLCCDPSVLALLWLKMPLCRGGMLSDQHAFSPSSLALPSCYQIFRSCFCSVGWVHVKCPNSCPLLQVSDFRLASAFTATAINGPPVQGGLPVFTWRRFNHTRHQGLPDSYNFHFVTMRPIL